MQHIYCARCRRHGLKVIRYKHREICPYLNCTCYPCSEVTAKNERERSNRARFNNLKNISVSSIKGIQGLDVSLDSSTRSSNSSYTNQPSTRSDKQLIDTAIGPNTGYFNINDQSTQTDDNILIINMEPDEATMSNYSTSPIIYVLNQKDLMSKNTDQGWLKDTGYFILSCDQSFQTFDNILLANMEPVEITSSHIALPITDVLNDRQDITSSNTGQDFLPDTQHFILSLDQSTQTCDDISSTNTQSVEVTSSTNSILSITDVTSSQQDIRLTHIDQDFLAGSDFFGRTDQSTQICDITDIVSDMPTTSNRSNSPITDVLKNQYDQAPCHTDQELLKRFGCIPCSVVLKRLRNPEMYY